MTSKQRSLIGVAALLAIAATQACGSSDEPTPPAATAGAAPTGAAGSHAGGATTSGGSTSAGAPSTAAGAPSTAAGAGGASAGAPSTSAGAGGASAGSGAGGASAGSGAGGSHAGGSSGGASGGSSGGGSGATFAAVKTLIGMKCGTGTCHNKASGHVDFQGTTDLHGLLTTALPSNALHCGGSTLAVAGNAAMSLLVAITSTTTNSAKCTTGNGTVDKMPSGCSGTGASACLTADQIKVFSDWIAAGAPAQ